nr:DUF2878 domain-containing protein [uncultured Pseudoxanthomonas sp.]
MQKAAWRTLLNVAGNQIVWFIAVIAAGRGDAWPGVLAAAVFVGVHLAWAPRRGDELKLVALAVACGLVVDGVAAAQGWVTYRASMAGGGVAPAWILALWASLAVTLNGAMRSLQARWWAEALLGGIGGPLAYLAAARGWGAAEFAAPAWRAWAWLAIGWAIALPGLLAAARWQARHSPHGSR